MHVLSLVSNFKLDYKIAPRRPPFNGHAVAGYSHCAAVINTLALRRYLDLFFSISILGLEKNLVEQWAHRHTHTQTLKPESLGSAGQSRRACAIVARRDMCYCCSLFICYL